MRSSTLSRALYGTTAVATLAFVAAVFVTGSDLSVPATLADRASAPIGEGRSLGTVPQSGSDDADLVLATDSVRTFVANFYAAYSAGDASRLAAAFAPDATAGLVAQRLALFTGKDRSGNPAGPRLFADAATVAPTAAYRLESAAQEGAGWRLLLAEDRSALSQTSPAATTETELLLLPAPAGTGTWLVESYSYRNGTGKYAAFLRK